MRRRISIRKEDRIWNLRCQGYTYDTIARITNVRPSSVTEVLRRVRRRPPFEEDPIRRGRGCGFLDDYQINDIRFSRARGEKYASIAARYHVTPQAIVAICVGRTYRQPEYTADEGYPFSFGNRLQVA